MTEPHHGERRRWMRASPLATEDVVHCRLRGGEPALVVNLSRGGALLETSQRVLPGRRYVLHWRRAGRVCAVNARMLRASVLVVGPSRVVYQGAMAFDEESREFWELTTHSGTAVPICGGEPKKAVG